MKIQSPFKDYYDYVETLYGCDPKVVYKRGTIIPYKLPVKKQLTFNADTIKFDMEGMWYDNDLPYYRSTLNWTFKWLVITGKCYLVVKNKTGLDERVFDRDYHCELANIINNVTSYKFRGKDYFSHFVGRHDSKFDFLSKKISQPVFMIRHVYKDSVEIESSIPKLSNLGLATIIDPCILYQDIYMYLTNVIRTNPDISTPITVSNSDRITQHGFDIKKSFRHRNEK